MENDFTNLLTCLTPNNELLDTLKEAIRIAHKVELNSMESTERKLNLKIAELKDKKNKLLDLRVEGKIKDEDFIPANEKYKSEIAVLEKEMSSLFVPELEIDNLIDSSIEFLKHLPENWKSLDVKDLRVLRTLLFLKILSMRIQLLKLPKYA